MYLNEFPVLPHYNYKSSKHILHLLIRQPLWVPLIIMKNPNLGLETRVSIRFRKHTRPPTRQILISPLSPSLVASGPAYLTRPFLYFSIIIRLSSSLVFYLDPTLIFKYIIIL